MARPLPSLAVLRDAIQRRVDETSLRETTVEIGIGSHTALRRFLRGETENPHPRTRDAMHRWYVRRVLGEPAIPREYVETAISWLRTWTREGPKARSVNERRLDEIVKELREE